MNRNLILVMLLIATLSGVGFAQTSPPSSPEPTSTPKPVKRRTFDQFDLSNGVRVGNSNTASMGYGSAKPSTVEFVDEQTYAGIRKLVEFVSDTGAEYRAAVPGTTTNEWEPLSVLNRKINATYKITELFHDGLLGQTPLKDPVNTMLLEDSQLTLREAGNVVAISGGWSKNPVMLAKMKAKYNADETVPDAGGTRRAVLIAMLAKLDRDFSQLLSQIAVRKQ